MTKSFLFLIGFICSMYTNTQNITNNFSLSLSGGNFQVGKGYITGIWTGIEGAKIVYTGKRTLLHKITLAGEMYFERGADKATIYNPTWEQFVADRYYHESNTGLTAKISYYPFGGFMKGFHIAQGHCLFIPFALMKKEHS